MNHLYHLLSQYSAQLENGTLEEQQWSCATVVTRSGSSYRLPGAMMLINPLGQSYGLVSGGCLESDVRRRSQKVWQMGQADYVIYDTSDEESFASRLGLGCNGIIGVLIQAIGPSHHQLLSLLFNRLKAKKHSYLLQCFQSSDVSFLNHWALVDEQGGYLFSTDDCIVDSVSNLASSSTVMLPQKQTVASIEGSEWSIANIASPVNLWVLGGGIDAEPLVKLAATLGWLVTVVDHRTGYARPTQFKQAHQVLSLAPEQAIQGNGFDQADAFIAMTHNKNIDAQWMEQLKTQNSAKYIAMLGPKIRKQEVMEMANASQDFSAKVFGPAGMEQIQGDLPESIALSIISQCHAELNHR